MTNPTLIAEQLRPYALLHRQAGAGELDGRRRCGRRRGYPEPAGIPTFPFPDTAAKAFADIVEVRLQPEGHYRRRHCAPSEPGARTACSASSIVRRSPRQRAAPSSPSTSPRSCWSPTASSTVRTEIASGVDQAIEIAGQIGDPVVLKLYSETITHKTDVAAVAAQPEKRRRSRFAFDEIRRQVEQKMGPGISWA